MICFNLLYGLLPTLVNEESSVTDISQCLQYLKLIDQAHAQALEQAKTIDQIQKQCDVSFLNAPTPTKVMAVLRKK